MVLFPMTAFTNHSPLSSVQSPAVTSLTSAMMAQVAPCDPMLTQSMLCMFKGCICIMCCLEPDPWIFTKIIIPKIKAEWRDFALSLRLPTSEISTIEKESCNSKDLCQRLISKWLDTSLGCTPKTWQTLLKCIKDVDDLATAAEEICIELSMCSNGFV